MERNLEGENRDRIEWREGDDQIINFIVCSDKSLD